MIRFVFLVLHTPTAGGEAAQEFQRGHPADGPGYCTCGPRAITTTASRYKQANPNSRNLLNIATLAQGVNRTPELNSGLLIGFCKQG